MKQLWKRRFTCLAGMALVFALACIARVFPWDTFATGSPDEAAVGTATLSDAGDTVFIRMATFNVGTQAEPEMKQCAGFTVGNLGPANNPTQNVDVNVLTPIHPGAPLSGTLDKDIYICSQPVPADLYVNGLTLTAGHSLTAAGSFDMKMGALTVDTLNAADVQVNIGDQAVLTVNGDAAVKSLRLYKPYGAGGAFQIDPKVYNPQLLPGTLHVGGDLTGTGWIDMSNGSTLTVNGSLSGFQGGGYNHAITVHQSSLTVGGNISGVGRIALAVRASMEVSGAVTASSLNASNECAVQIGGSLDTGDGEIAVTRSALNVGGSLTGGNIYYGNPTANPTVGGNVSGTYLLCYNNYYDDTTISMAVSGNVTLTETLDINSGVELTAGDVVCKELCMNCFGKTNTLNAASLTVGKNSSLSHGVVNVRGDCVFNGTDFVVHNNSALNVGGSVTSTGPLDIVSNSSLSVTGDITVTGENLLSLRCASNASAICGGDITATGAVYVSGGSDLTATGAVCAGGLGVFASGGNSSVTVASLTAPFLNAISQGSICVTGDVTLTGHAFVGGSGNSLNVGGDMNCDNFQFNGGQVSIAGDLLTNLTRGCLGSGVVSIGGDFVSTGTGEIDAYDNAPGLAVYGGTLSVGGNIEFGSLMLNTDGHPERVTVGGTITATRITNLSTYVDGQTRTLHAIAPFRAKSETGFFHYTQPYRQSFVLLGDETETNYYVADISDLTKTYYDNLVSTTRLDISLNPGAGAEWVSNEPYFPLGYDGVSFTLPGAADLTAPYGYHFGGWSASSGGAALYSGGETLTLTENLTLYTVWTPNQFAVADITAMPYTGSAVTPTLTVTDSLTPTAGVSDTEYTVSYKKGGVSVDTPLEAGTYTVVVSGKAGGGYCGATAVEKAFTVSKIGWNGLIGSEVTAMRDNGAELALGTDTFAPGASWAASGTTAGGIAYTIGTDAVLRLTSVPNQIMTDEIALAVTDATNYNDYTFTVAVTVTDKNAQTVSFAAADMEKTYGDAEFVNAASSTGDGTITYAVTAGADVATVDPDTGAVRILKSGTATVTATAAEAATYAEASESYVLTVGRKAVTVRANDVTRPADFPEPTLTATVTGLVGSDSVSYTLTRAAGEQMGDYVITADGAAEQGSYTVSYEPGTFTITYPFFGESAVRSAATVAPAPVSEAVTNADGSRTTRELESSTTTVTNRDGSVTVTEACKETVTTAYPDQSSVKTVTEQTTETTTASVTNADGSVTETEKLVASESVTETSTAADGTETVTETLTERTRDAAVTTAENADGSETETTDATETLRRRETVTGPDGTKTETETRTETKTHTVLTRLADGSAKGTSQVTETVRDSRGNVVRTTETSSEIVSHVSADGSVTTETASIAVTVSADGMKTAERTVTRVTETPDGTAATVVTDENGNVLSMAVSVSREEFESAIEENRPIRVPMTVTPADAEDAARIRVELPPCALDRDGDGQVSPGERPRIEFELTVSGSGIIVAQYGANGTLHINKECYEGSVIAPITGSCELAVLDQTKTFTDVDAAAWYGEYVTFVTAREIFNGVGNGRFAPKETVTRGMAAQVLCNFARGAAGDGTVFTDVSAKDWFSAALGWAYTNGVFEGRSDGSVGAKDALTRQDLATVLYRFAKAAGYDVSASADLDAFADADRVSAYAGDAMRWAVGAGLINGLTDSEGRAVLDPRGSATRAQLAGIMTRFVRGGA